MPEVIECYYLVKKHQVNVLEAVLIFGIQIQARLGILDIVICEVSHKAAGEWRQVFQFWRSVLFNQILDYLTRIISFNGYFIIIQFIEVLISFDINNAILAGEFQKRIEA